MSLFSNLRAERLIAEIKASGEGETDTRKALDKLVKLGPSAIPRIIDALANADKQETAGFVSALSSMLDQRTFPVVAEGLMDGNQRTVAAVVWAMRDRFISVATSREPQPPTFRAGPGGGIPVDRIDGIGPVFAQRLTDAGLGDVTSLAAASPDRVAEAAGVSAARARNWIELAAGH